jgi:hypothetical protein
MFFFEEKKGSFEVDGSSREWLFPGEVSFWKNKGLGSTRYGGSHNDETVTIEAGSFLVTLFGH